MCFESRCVRRRVGHFGRSCSITGHMMKAADATMGRLAGGIIIGCVIQYTAIGRNPVSDACHNRSAGILAKIERRELTRCEQGEHTGKQHRRTHHQASKPGDG